MATRGATSSQQQVIDRLIRDLAGVLHHVDTDIPERLRPAVWSTMRSVIDGAEATYFANAIGTDPDIGNTITKRWLRDRDNNTSVEKRHARHRRERRAYKTPHDDTPTIVVKATSSPSNKIWTQITKPMPPTAPQAAATSPPTNTSRSNTDSSTPSTNASPTPTHPPMGVGVRGQPWC